MVTMKVEVELMVAWWRWELVESFVGIEGTQDIQTCSEDHL